jgi:hypothetical protein
MDKVDPVLNRDLTAAYLSIVPGLGHLYKHQWGLGLTILTLGNIVAGLITGLLSFATLGAAIIVAPVVWIAWAAYDAYHEPDLSHLTKKRAASA